MKETQKRNKITHDLKSKLYRAILMLLFFIILYYLFFVLMFLSLLQTVFVLIESKNNIELSRAQAYLRAYVINILSYLDYSSEQKPFPFSPFPKI